MDRISFTTQISEDEVVAAGWHITVRHVLKPAALMYLLLIVVAIAIDFEQWRTHWDLTMFIIPIASGSIFLLLAWRYKSKIRQTYRDNFRLQGPISYTIDDQQCVQSGESFRLDIPWDKIIQVERWRGAYLLYPNKRSAHLIPAKALTSENERILQEILDRVKPGWRK